MMIFEPQRPQRTRRIVVFCFALSVLFVVHTDAQDLGALEKQILATQSELQTLAKEYEKEKKANERRLQEKQLQQAYASAERMNAVNKRLNELKTEQVRLCEKWRSAYRKTVDDLLASAEDKQIKEKGTIGKQLQKMQEKNASLCPQETPVMVSEKWRELKIENYDGPAEIQQKLLLLKDISRELSLSLARLDRQHQETLREQRTRERAEEFIQEGTLFNDGLTVRSPTFSTTGTPTGTPTSSGSEVIDRSSDNGNTSPAVNAGSSDWREQTEGRSTKKDYEKQRAELLALQKGIAAKIESFTRANQELLSGSQ
jgi:hypothetical protein